MKLSSNFLSQAEAPHKTTYNGFLSKILRGQFVTWSEKHTVRFSLCVTTGQVLHWIDPFEAVWLRSFDIADPCQNISCHRNLPLTLFQKISCKYNVPVCLWRFWNIEISITDYRDVDSKLQAAGVFLRRFQKDVTKKSGVCCINRQEKVPSEVLGVISRWASMTWKPSNPPSCSLLKPLKTCREAPG